MYLTILFWLEHRILHVKTNYMDIKEALILIRVWCIRNEYLKQPVLSRAF
jgi:hypothetical protein